MKGKILGLFFNTKATDEQGNHIQPVVVVESKGEKFRIYFPKQSTEVLKFGERTIEKGQIIDLEYTESAGFLRSEENMIKSLTGDTRSKEATTVDSRQEAIHQGQAFNLAFEYCLKNDCVNKQKIVEMYLAVRDMMRECHES